LKTYSVQKLAKLAGVSVRTLHHYDRLGLLKPSVRTEARYRLYGEKELIRLQQILFYKELDFPLGEIRTLLDDPAFDLKTALRSHRQALLARRDRLSVLLDTLDKTMSQLNGEKVMLTDAELYAGFSKEQAEAYRTEAAGKYGEETIRRSENHLRGLSKEQFEALKAENVAVSEALFALQEQDPASSEVQQLIARHFAVILQFWGGAVPAGDELKAYRGLAQLYLDDLRYTRHQGQEQPAYAAFLSRAMVHFADSKLGA